MQGWLNQLRQAEIKWQGIDSHFAVKKVYLRTALMKDSEVNFQIAEKLHGRIWFSKFLISFVSNSISLSEIPVKFYYLMKRSLESKTNLPPAYYLVSLMFWRLQGWRRWEAWFHVPFVWLQRRLQEWHSPPRITIQSLRSFSFDLYLIWLTRCTTMITLP